MITQSDIKIGAEFYRREKRHNSLGGFDSLSVKISKIEDGYADFFRSDKKSGSTDSIKIKNLPDWANRNGLKLKNNYEHLKKRMIKYGCV